MLCLLVITCLVLITSVKPTWPQNVTLTYTTDYPNGTEYYIVHGKEITLNCSFPQIQESVEFRTDTILITRIDQDGDSIVDDYLGRLSVSRDGSDYLFHLTVDYEEDEGKEIWCQGFNPTLSANASITIQEILGEYLMKL